jgi:hypothetical protein
VGSAQNDRTDHLTRRLLSPVIKSWKKAEERRVLSLLVDLVAAFSNGEMVLVDLFVAEKAAAVEERLGEVELAMRRHSPSQELRHRIGRSVGAYTYASGLSVVVRIRAPIQLNVLLMDDVIWDADFTVYPNAGSDVANLPDPHLASEAFSDHVAWSLAQQTGAPGWSMTARDLDELKRLETAAAEVFRLNGLAVDIR